MFLRGKLKKSDKEVGEAKDYIIDSDGNAIINIKATSEEEIFSVYNYDSNEKLNDELGEFIADKARFVPISKPIKIKLFTEAVLEKKEVEQAIKNNFKKDLIEVTNEIKLNFKVSLSMFIAGLLFMTFLLLMHTYFYNIYADIVFEIITWVFIWEAADTYFLERTVLKRRKLKFLKLFSADIEIVKLKSLGSKQG